MTWDPSKSARLAVSVLLAVSPASPAFACLHGAKPALHSAETGIMSGSTRTERIVAVRDADAPKIVKLFVGPPNASVQIKELGADEIAAHKALAQKAEGLNPYVERTRGMATRGMPQPVAEYTTKSGVKITVESIGAMSWGDIQSRYSLPASGHESSYVEWVKRVGPEAKRSLYAAVVDVSQQQPGDSEEIYGLAVTIPYSGSAASVRQQVVLDKWLEYLGTYKVSVILHTNWDDAALANNMSEVMSASWDLQEDHLVASATASSDGVDVGVAGGKPFFMMRGGDLYFYNNANFLTAHHAPPPAGGAAATDGKQQDPGAAAAALARAQKAKGALGIVNSNQ